MSELKLVNLKEVLSITTLSRSTWFDGVREGRYPSPISIGKRRIAWKYTDIKDLINQNARKFKPTGKIE